MLYEFWESKVESHSRSRGQQFPSFECVYTDCDEWGMAKTSSITARVLLGNEALSVYPSIRLSVYPSICKFLNFLLVPYLQSSKPRLPLPFFSLNKLSHPSLPPRGPTAFHRRRNPCSNCIPSASPSPTTRRKRIKTRKAITYISNPSQSPAQSWAIHPPHSARPCHPFRSNKSRYPCPFPSPSPAPRHPRPHAPSPARG